jgi:hypothetical protein
LLAFREAADGLSWQVGRWLGSFVECVDAQGEKRLIGLENLYRRARREPRDSWPALIADFLRVADASEAEEMPENLAAVSDRLLVRLGTPLARLPSAEPVWSQPLGDSGLCVNLVVDSDNRMCYVFDQLVRDSGKPGSAWFEQALANLRGRTPADCLEVIDEDSGMRLCAVGDAYDSSRALLLDVLLPETAADGYFVALPGRDQLLVLPVNVQGLANVHFLRIVAQKHFRDAPYPISDEVYWVRAGVWRLFPIDIKGQNVAIQPPEEFVEILQRLAPEEDLSGPDEPPDEEGYDDTAEP